jgi:Gem-associated protein 7 (Gemin7)
MMSIQGHESDTTNTLSDNKSILDTSSIQQDKILAQSKPLSSTSTTCTTNTTSESVAPFPFTPIVSSSTNELNVTRRLNTLHFFEYAKGKRIELQLFDHTTVTGIFTAVPGDQSEIALEQLKTPMGVYPHARIRISDVISLVIIPPE